MSWQDLFMRIVYLHYRSVLCHWRTSQCVRHNVIGTLLDYDTDETSYTPVTDTI